ncbi:hypothetical protein [Microbacterium enclense]|uniref:hypothetical protein n=1 Tax=Microbacterium enclense TaxID=993073 RepID=UPI003D75C5D6
MTDDNVENDPFATAARGRSIWARDAYEQFDELIMPLEDIELISPWVDLWRTAILLAKDGPDSSIDLTQQIRQAISAALATLDRAGTERLADLRGGIEPVIPQLIDVYVRSGHEADIDEVRDQYRFARFHAKYGYEQVVKIDRLATELRDEMNSLSEVERRATLTLEQANAAADRADEAASRAASASVAASDAAGKAGTNGLAKEFKAFADGHQKSSNAYRFWTIFVLVMAVATAMLFVLGIDRLWLQAIGAPPLGGDTAADTATAAAAEGQRWQAVVYRIAILGGLAGLSAYLGRQAAQHRRLLDWGRAVEAQARSFEAFAKQIIDPETKNQVQLLFSNRVLGSPPEPTAEKTVARDALQIVADAAMKSRGTTP